MSLRETFESLDPSLQVVAGVAVVIVGLFVVTAAIGGVAVVGSFVLASDGGDGTTAAPEAAFSAESTEDGAVLTLERGDRLEAANLSVVVDDTERSWAALSGQRGTLAPGDSVTVDADPGTQVELVYDGGNERITYAVYTA